MRQEFVQSLFFTNITHVRAFELRRYNSSAVTFVPGCPAEPRVLLGAYQGFARGPAEDFLAFAFAGCKIQFTSIKTFFPYERMRISSWSV